MQIDEFTPATRAMVHAFPAAKYLHDYENSQLGWFRGPNWPIAGGPNEVILWMTVCTNIPSLFAAALVAEGQEKHTQLKHENTLVGSLSLVVVGIVFASTNFGFRMGCCEDDTITVTGIWTVLWGLLMSIGCTILFVMDRIDGGSRAIHFVGQFIRFWCGAGLGVGVQTATNITWQLWTPIRSSLYR